MDFYRLSENIGEYPKGLLVYIVESRGWMGYNDAGDWTRMSDGKVIGTPNTDNIRVDNTSYCVEKHYFVKHPHKFIKEMM